MTTSQVRGIVTAGDDEQSIAAYLQQHPDFFERNQAVLARLKLPHARGGSTVSLVERQVEVLRERAAASDAKLAEFVRVARANEALADKIHRFSRRLLRATSFEATIAEIEASLREDFDAFHSVCILVGPVTPVTASAAERFLRTLPAEDANLRTFDSLFANGKPRCGQVRDTQREFLFGADAAGIGSVALVPLGRPNGQQGLFGLLALGSNDRERFHPGMSTEFLARMGELIADALARPGLPPRATA
jgi:uncharacterized protein YigA (DUF484 family)